MADEKRKQYHNSKWSKVPVLIEEALDDVIVVCLKLGSKEFRGILLDTAKRNVPHGICFAPKPANVDKSGENDVNSTSIPGNDIGHQQISVSTTSQRFTYNHDPSEYSEKPVLLGPKNTIRPVGKKSVRDIRLRPRRTLCSNCKNTIHEYNKHDEGKSNNTLSSSRPGKPSSVSSTRSPSRYLAPPKHTKPSSSRSPSHYVSNRTVTTCKWSLRNRSNSKEVLLRLPEPTKKRSNSNATSTFLENKTVEQNPVKPKSTKVEKPPSPKATPFIKISYGDGAVLNIPPRLPGMDSGVVESSSEDPSASPQKEVQNYVSHKKLKKAMKKAKERERHRSGDQLTKSVSVELDEKGSKISSHHKKHKRKHKHRHANQYHTTDTKDGDKPPVMAELVSNVESDWNGNGESRTETSNESNYYEKTNVFNDTDNSKVENGCNDTEYMYVEYDEQPLVIDEGANMTDDGKDENIDQISTVKNYSDWIDHIEANNDEDHENARPLDEDNSAERPRLVYMWKQNQGLARVEPRTGSSQTGDNRGSMSSDDLDQDTESRYSASDSNDSYNESDSDVCNDYPGSPQSEVTDSPVDTLRPLMMKIQSQSVSKCVMADDRTIHVEDIVWGKIQGFPWWPGRVMSIMVTQKDNGIIITQTAHVSWFGSSTMSHMQCSELYPFLEDFKLRYNKKKRGPYRSAIKQATLAAQAAFSNTNANIDIDMEEFEL
ncbi:uncharacterized protein LOC121384234 [Gigantopelta aegis]|uniref:uncharacterized protein LOC121384234 n=1 Tax=Gigantopelta aegis TaxID=1735272 RepID=UPI001B889CCB|nr:uncharacterized protein LOC121384234 [Gigantopelta aegis]